MLCSVLKIISQYHVFTPNDFEINLLIINTLSYIKIYSNGIKTVLLEYFIKIIEYGECSIRVYRSNILGIHFA